ncbi:hypothetical protein WIV_gp190 [Wiseana iridescent virus]|uniref:Uncharacterized protein n=1 Tax=Wiseana iridescent virus TaxID=68347 RepID=G0T5L6_IRV9|nr:hypothetical protein WIV_gp190 [Wiseana iridescent virus]ADO00534.1 hypothetical protein [Wiseana iridescent virus]
MDTINLTIIIFFLIVGVCLLLKIIRVDTPSLTQDTDYLINQYHKKPKWIKKTVVIIESFTSIDDLLELLKNILKQDIKVDSIVLISQNENLNKVRLISNTCLINKHGGLSFFLKEGDSNTILLFLFPPSFKAFSNPVFLQDYLTQDFKVNGLVKAETNSVCVDINKVYTSL